MRSRFLALQTSRLKHRSRRDFLRPYKQNMNSLLTKLFWASLVIALASFRIAGAQPVASSPPLSPTTTAAAKSAEATASLGEQAKQDKEKKVAVAGRTANETRDALSGSSPKTAKIVRIRDGDDLSVEVGDLKERVEKQPAAFKTIRLFLDCKPVEGVTPVPCIGEKKIVFRLDEEAIKQITTKTKIVSAGISFTDPQNAEVVMPEKVQLVLVANDYWLWIVWGIVLLVAILLYIYGRNTNLLRDGQPPEAAASVSPAGPTPGAGGQTFHVLRFLPGFHPVMWKRSERAQYSLAKVQMAWWLFFIVSAFLFIWLAVGDFNSLTTSTLVLLGISVGTTVASKMVASSKQAAAEDLKATKKTLETQVNQIARVNAGPDTTAAVRSAAFVAAAPSLTDVERQEFASKNAQLEQVQAQFDKLTQKPAEAKSQGFLTDIMSDENGISIHRFQMVVWTVVLTLIFISEVKKNLSMPEFSSTLLTLMGISSGAYVTLKIPEKKSVVTPP
jgi:hypothetical protein